MIRMNVSEETLETGVGLDRVVKDILWYQIFYKNALGKDIRLKAIQKAMYDSKYERPFLLKKLKMETQFNLLKPLCDTATSTFLGRVPDIVTSAGNLEKDRISTFSLLQKHNDFEEEIYDVALQESITGSGFICLYNEEGDSFPKYRSLDPLH